MKQGALIFNELTDRYDIRFDLADYYGGLHCGECLEVFTGGKWKPTRIEYGDNWYLVGTRFLCLLRMFFPTSYYGGKRLFAKAGQKKNAAIFIKGCNALSYLFSFLVRLLQSLSPLRLQSVSPYRSYRQAARRAAAVASFSRLSYPGKRIGLRICHNGLQAHRRFAGSAVALCSQCSQDSVG